MIFNIVFGLWVFIAILMIFAMIFYKGTNQEVEGLAAIFCISMVVITIMAIISKFA